MLKVARSISSVPASANTGGGRLFDGFMLGPAEAQQKVQLMASKMSKDDGKALPSLPFTAAAAS